MTISNSTVRKQLFCLIFLAASHVGMAQTNLPKTLSQAHVQTIQLSSEEILQAFANVRDDAEVQDVTGTRAVNYWYAEGRFVSRWSNGIDCGEVVGAWRVENNLRCITISSGLAQRIGKESCSAVFRRGKKYLSSNSDGSIHGIHTLSPLLEPSEAITSDASTHLQVQTPKMEQDCDF